MSAIVLAALVIMWAVVLVPMLLRRHDRASELAGAARFAGAMRVLSRRRANADPELVSDVIAKRRAAVFSQAVAWSPASKDLPDTRTSTGSPASPGSLALPSAQPLSARPPLRHAPDRRAEAMAGAMRRSERVSARRRGLALMVGLVVASALAAVLVGGWLVWLQVVVDLLALAGLAQLRATAIAERYARPVPAAATRTAARLTHAPATARVPAHETGAVSRIPPRPTVATPAAQAYAVAVGDDVVATPRRASRKIVYDAVSEMPIVEKPRLRAGGPAAAGGTPEDFYDHPDSPPGPEWVHVQLLDEVDSDPDTLTDGLELLDGILDRASGE